MAYLTELAQRHVSSNNLKGRTPIYSASRFVRLVGDLQPSEITEHHIATYRAKCLELGMSARTIESSIAIPEAATNDADQSWKRLFAVACKAFQKCTTEARSSPPAKMIAETTFPAEYCLENTKKIVRSQLVLCCQAASVPVWTPKQLRQRSITEWSRANATAGAIVHGCGLGVLSHYLNPLQILESAAPRVRLPECFGATNSSGEDSLVANFRRLDAGAQGLLTMTAERLAAG